MASLCASARTLLLYSALCAAAAVHADGGGGSVVEADVDLGRELATAQRLIDAKDWPNAIAELERAQRKDQRNADVHNLLGYSLRHSGRLKEAIGHYERALSLDPRHRGAHEYLGEAWLQSRRPDKAREQLATLKSLCGTDCEPYLDLARAISAYEAGTPSASR